MAYKQNLKRKSSRTFIKLRSEFNKISVAAQIYLTESTNIRKNLVFIKWKIVDIFDFVQREMRQFNY